MEPDLILSNIFNNKPQWKRVLLQYHNEFLQSQESYIFQNSLCIVPGSWFESSSRNLQYSCIKKHFNYTTPNKSTVSPNNTTNNSSGNSNGSISNQRKIKYTIASLNEIKESIENENENSLLSPDQYYSSILNLLKTHLDSSEPDSLIHKSSIKLIERFKNDFNNFGLKLKKRKLLEDYSNSNLDLNSSINSNSSNGNTSIDDNSDSENTPKKIKFNLHVETFEIPSNLVNKEAEREEEEEKKKLFSLENLFNHLEVPKHSDFVPELLSPLKPLFQYQKNSLAKMIEMEANKELRGGIIAEPMGSGKTIILLALVLSSLGSHSRFFASEWDLSKPVPTRLKKLKTNKNTMIIDGMEIDDEVDNIETFPKLIELVSKEIKVLGVPYKTRLPLNFQRIIEKYTTNVSGKLLRVSNSVRNPQILERKLLCCNTTLILVPKSILDQWRYELMVQNQIKFIIVEDYDKNFPTREKIIKFDVLLVAHNRLSIDDKLDPNSVWIPNNTAKEDKPKIHPLLQIHFKRLIIDEGHIVGNKSNITFNSNSISAENRWVCSGTPLNSNLLLQELSNFKSILGFLHVKKLTDFYWSKQILSPIKNFQTKGLENLSELLKLYTIRTPISLILNEIKLQTPSITLVKLPLENDQILSYNIIIALMQTNLLSSQYEGPDSLFSTKNHKYVIATINNLKKACFFFEPTNEKDISDCREAIINSILKPNSIIPLKDKITLLTIYNFLIKVSEYFNIKIINTINSLDIINENNNGNNNENNNNNNNIINKNEVIGEIDTSPNNINGEPVKIRSLSKLKKGFVNKARRSLNPEGKSPEEVNGEKEHLSSTTTTTSFSDNHDNSEMNIDNNDGTANSLPEHNNPQIDIHMSNNNQNNNNVNNIYNQSNNNNNSTTISSNNLALSLQIQPIVIDGSIKIKKKSKMELTVLEKKQSALERKKLKLERKKSLEDYYDNIKSTKLKYLLDKLRGNENKCIVFSQYNQTIDILVHHFKKEGFNFIEYHTGVPARVRPSNIIRFQTDRSIKIIIMALDLAAFGINLTAATHIYIVDPIWSNKVEKQAIARAQRIGQTQRVFVEKIIINNSLELILSNNSSNLDNMNETIQDLENNNNNNIVNNNNNNNENIQDLENLFDLENENTISSFTSQKEKEESESRKVKFILKNLQFINHPFYQTANENDLKEFILQIENKPMVIHSC